MNKKKANLCDVCRFYLHECENDNPKFGTGKENDSVYDCNTFRPLKIKNDLAEGISTITLKVEILEIEKTVPNDVVDDFKEWVLSKGIELGLGRQHEYYSIDEDYKNDIGVSFKVYST